LPDWKWEVESRDQRVEISLNSPQGGVILVLQTEPHFSNLHSLISIVRAGEVVYGVRDVRSFEGWFSPTYGRKVPALSLSFEVKSNQPTQFITEFNFPHEN